MPSEIVTVPGCLKYTMTFLTVKEKDQKTVFHLIASFHRSTRTSSAGFYWIQIEANSCQNGNSKIIDRCCALLFASGEKCCYHCDYWELRQKACEIWVIAVVKVIWMYSDSSTKIFSSVWVLLASEVADSIVTIRVTFHRKNGKLWEGAYP